jgi:hypothetical protein
VLAEAAGRDRVRSSMDPAWAPLAERVRTRFKPDWSLLAEGPRGSAVASSALGRMFPGYLRMAERFARSERRSDTDGVMGERTSEGGKVVDRIVAAGGQSPMGSPAAEERLENPFQREYVTLVEVTHRDDGSVERIQLRRSSGLGPVDRLALAATRRALDEGDLAPVAGQARTSVWTFTTTFGVIPPLPVVGCPPEVAWTGELARCAYPMKQYAESRVELIGLE